MFLRSLITLTCLSLGLVLPARAEENAWPFLVKRSDVAGTVESWESLGPLLFQQRNGSEVRGFRPLFMTTRTGDVTTGNFLYPFFTWRYEPGYRTFSFFKLVNFRSDSPSAAETDRHFDIWPVYFSRSVADDPAGNYHAVFPLGGTIKNRFGRDRINFVLFPLYGQTLKNGKQTTNAPWPFLSFIGGEGYHGFEFWPLFGRQGRAHDYERQFYIWPLFYKSVTHLDEPVPEVKVGVLPFYSRDTGPGYISETYGWPFFGYSDRTVPYRYHETRYFWPLFVQGHGDQREVNRWAPFYTHSNIKGYDKTWFLWPLVRHAQWDDTPNNLVQEKNQFLFFVYWSLEQRSLTNPAAAPARKTHLWPLYSSWSNGAGRRQVQALSPFEVFFPNNREVRQLWTPLFALYRYDAEPELGVRHSFLWNAITYRRGAAGKEFHLGPLFSVEAGADRRRVALGNGLLGFQRKPGAGWRFFLFDFRMKPTIMAPATSP
jgi:hypothetical protein